VAEALGAPLHITLGDARQQALGQHGLARLPRHQLTRQEVTHVLVAYVGAVALVCFQVGGLNFRLTGGRVKARVSTQM
jgi:hypothetical protein